MEENLASIILPYVSCAWNINGWQVRPETCIWSASLLFFWQKWIFLACSAILLANSAFFRPGAHFFGMRFSDVVVFEDSAITAFWLSLGVQLWTKSAVNKFDKISNRSVSVQNQQFYCMLQWNFEMIETKVHSEKEKLKIKRMPKSDRCCF